MWKDSVLGILFDKDKLRKSMPEDFLFLFFFFERKRKEEESNEKKLNHHRSRKVHNVAATWQNLFARKPPRSRVPQTISIYGTRQSKNAIKRVSERPICAPKKT